MKFISAQGDHEHVVEEFFRRQESKGSQRVTFDEIWTSAMSPGGVDLYIVTDHVHASVDMAGIYDHPKLGDDMVVGLILVDIPQTDQDDPSGVVPLARSTAINIAPEYYSEVSVVLLLQDFIEHIITNGIPYKLLWFDQASDSEHGDPMLVKAMESSELATGYLNDHSGMEGYCIDLRVGHYLWSVLNRRKQGEE